MYTCLRPSNNFIIELLYLRVIVYLLAGKVWDGMGYCLRIPYYGTVWDEALESHTPWNGVGY